MSTHPEFEVHILNEQGIANAKELANVFNELLTKVIEICERPGTSGSITLPRNAFNGRYLSLVRTKLEEASFFAKKAMAVLPENQK
jgi:hypothetical protein